MYVFYSVVSLASTNVVHEPRIKEHGFEVKRYLEFNTLTLKKVSHPNKKIFSTMFCLRITRLLERLQNLFKSSIQTKVQAVRLVLRQRGQLRQC